MAVLALTLDEDARKKLDELAKETDGGSVEALVARLLPRWIEGHLAYCAWVEVGRRDAQEGRWREHDEVFDEIEADLLARIRAEDQAATAG